MSDSILQKIEKGNAGVNKDEPSSHCLWVLEELCERVVQEEPLWFSERQSEILRVEALRRLIGKPKHHLKRGHSNQRAETEERFCAKISAILWRGAS